MYQFNPHSKVQMLFKLTTQHLTFRNYYLCYLLTFTIQTKCNSIEKKTFMLCKYFQFILTGILVLVINLMGM